MDAASVFLGVITLQRLAELVWARRNSVRLLAAGGLEFGRAHYPLMVALHAAWLGGLWIIGRSRAVDPLFVMAYVALQAGRLWVLTTLRTRWTTRVIVIPGGRPFVGGLYRLVNHPNYWIVAGEIAVVPLALGLPLYAVVFFLLNCIVMAVRIPVENAALAWASSQEGIQASHKVGSSAGNPP